MDYTEVFSTGGGVDLEGIVYHPGVADYTPGYYRFLAGLVATLKAQSVLEIGTWHGGSTRAMSAALPRAEAVGRRPQVVTVDVTWHDESLGQVPAIKRVLGDSLSPRTYEQLARWFDGERVDLLYVDSGHDDRQTFENVAAYGNLLRPRFIVVDDIRLNDSMRRTWDRMVALNPGACTDVSELVARTDVGFGVIECEYPFAWPESSRARLAAWRAYWLAGRIVMPRLPTGAARSIRRVVRGQRR